MNLSSHFTLAELTRSDTATRLHIGNVAGEQTIIALRNVCEHILEPVRAHFGQPVRVNSGYRSPAANKAVGGAPSSQHVKGEAVDFEVPGTSNAEVAVWVRDNLDFDQLILEFYTSGQPSSGWVHCSWKPTARRKSVLTIGGGKTLTGLHP